MNFFFWILCGIIGATLYEHFVPRIFKKEALIIVGHRLHHSLYGLVAIIFGAALQNNALFAMGIGIVIQHTATDGFRFFSKEN